MKDKRLRDLITAAEKEFVLERGRSVSFIYQDNDLNKRNNLSEFGEVVVVSNKGEYNMTSNGEVIPINILLINPFKTIHNIKYELVPGLPPQQNFSWMKISDPVRIWRGYSVGDVIKVTVNDTETYYRKVC